MSGNGRTSRTVGAAPAVVYAMRQSFQNDDTEAVLLVDATNAFNALNRQVAVQNICQLCPSLAAISIKIYRSAADPYVSDSVLSSP